MTNANDPRVKNIAVISGGTEYSYHFSGNTKRIQIQNRNNNITRIAFNPGVVATPTGDYQTLKAGGIYFEEGINAGPRFYFAASAGDVIEILYWL